jgi:DNA-binding GntR family transcriptional regulator
MPAPKKSSEIATLETVRKAVREGILTGEYGPNQRLVEADICTQLNASRFLVRAALQDLASEGLVEVQRNKGARVRTISVEEAMEITEVRMVVEGLTAALAARRVTNAQASELEEVAVLMRRAVQVGELMRYSELNARLHALIRQIAGHETATRILQLLRGQIVRHEFAIAFQPGRSQASLAQHERLVAAIVKRDPVEAEAAARDHIASVIQALRDLPPRGMPMAAAGGRS